MNTFNEKAVRRCYDLLQHDPEVGLTQLNARDSGQIIGIGLFDNEKDFVTECQRYNSLGDLYVGVNPRPLRLLDQFAGLKNRMRSMFTDVTEGTEIEHVTGIAVPGSVRLSPEASKFRRETSILHDRELFFPLETSLDARAAGQIARWVTGSTESWTCDVTHFVRVPGTAIQGGGFFSRRVKFRRYRPYLLAEVSEAILAMSDGS